MIFFWERDQYRDKKNKKRRPQSWTFIHENTTSTVQLLQIFKQNYNHFAAKHTHWRLQRCSHGRSHLGRPKHWSLKKKKKKALRDTLTRAAWCGLYLQRQISRSDIARLEAVVVKSIFMEVYGSHWLQKKILLNEGYDNYMNKICRSSVKSEWYCETPSNLPTADKIASNFEEEWRFHINCSAVSQVRQKSITSKGPDLRSQTMHSLTPKRDGLVDKPQPPILCILKMARVLFMPVQPRLKSKMAAAW